MHQTGKKQKPALLIALVIFVVSVLIMNGFYTDWGKATVRRDYLLSENGHQYSYVSMVQKTSTDENPGPAVVMFHGNNESAQAFSSWGVELVRRGYNVFMLDVGGSGMSEPGFNDPTKTVLEFVEHIKTLPFVDSSRILATGHSRGGSWTGVVVTRSNIAGGVAVAAMRDQKQFGETYTGNLVTIIGEGDWMNRMYEPEGMNQKFFQKVYGTDGSLPEFEKEYGSVAENNYRVFVPYSGLNAQHCAGRWSPKVIGMVCDYLERMVPTDTTIAPRDTTAVILQYWVSLVAMISLIAVVINLILFVCKHPFFQEASQPIPPCIGRTGKRWIRSALLSMLPVVPWFIFINWLSAGPLKMTTSTALFPVSTTNRFILFYLGLGIYEIALFYFSFFRPGKLKMKECGLLYQDRAAKGQWIGIGKSALAAAIGCGFGLTILFVLDADFGISFQAWYMQLRGVSWARVSRSLLYLPIFLVLFIGMNLGGNISRRLPSTGHPTRDMIRDIVVNCLVGQLLLTIYFIINMRLNDMSVFWDVVDSVGHTYYMYNFILLGNAAAAGNTVLYRKTGSIWPGVFFCVIFLGIVIPGANPIG